MIAAWSRPTSCRARRRAWLTLEPEYELIKQMQYNDIDFGELFEVTEFSESDARALAEKYELDQPTAEIMAAAQRAYVFATENADYRRLAKAMEIDVVDAPEFVKRFTRKERARRRRRRRRPASRAELARRLTAESGPRPARAGAVPERS